MAAPAPGASGNTAMSTTSLLDTALWPLFKKKDTHGTAFVHLAGVRTLDMHGTQSSITDAAFVHLTGLRTLDMSGYTRRTITDAAFAHLTGLHTLNMSGCSQSSHA